MTAASQTSSPASTARPVALARHRGLSPFPRYQQHAATVMVRVTPSFVDDVLWPELQAISAELRVFLDEVTNRVTATAIHGDIAGIEALQVRRSHRMFSTVNF